ncbi:hypothetical protein INT80_09170 [Gallibacterium anatis]|uniref:Uncharacterized protein n=1 Tax=Gallibacterium anatis TaxID=750 RepID=A0A930UWL2_9PAST|nr:hypothetical protein [Gallibacterium anatis]
MWRQDGLTGVINGVTPSDGEGSDRVVDVDMAGGNDTINAMMVMGNTAIYTDSKNDLEGAKSGDDLITLRRGVWGWGKPAGGMDAPAMGMAGDGDQVFLPVPAMINLSFPGSFLMIKNTLGQEELKVRQLIIGVICHTAIHAQMSPSL